MDKTINITFVNNEDWDFRGVNTKYMTHGLHPYPAKMIPQITERLLKRYASKGDVALDPFCGSGGILVEARLAGMNSIGIDINPLACLLAGTKSNPIDPVILKEHWVNLKAEIGREIRSLRFRKITDIETPDFSGTNLEYWFKPTTIKELSIIRKHLEKIGENDVRRFFDVPFSITVRNSSGTRKGEFKLYRIPEEEWKKHSPNVFARFVDYAEEALERMAKFYEKCDRSVFSKVFMTDTGNMFTENFPKEANELLLNKPPKVIVTSPPYGDSRTTVAYGQFSRLSSLWLDFEDGFDRKTIMSVDNRSLGGNPKDLSMLDLPTFHQTLELIKTNSESRARDYVSFFSDLNRSLENMYTSLDENGYCCIVIANRTVSRIRIPTHAIIAEMGVEIGFENDLIMIPRKIPSKRLPWKNAPENIPGLKGRTMSKENIIIMRK